jgi:lysosomal Pro-X carboxypeptidase
LNVIARSQNHIRDDRCKQFRTFTQKVDHFGFVNMDTYEERYTLNTDHWESGKPIFFYAGNEGDIDLFCDNTGFMWDIAPIFNAMVVFAEHRYYGTSLPYGNASYSKPEYTRYLTSGQALADYAYLLDHIRSTIKGAEDSPTIVFGGSYGGMLAAYFRMKYPHVVAGAHAASAPILQMTTPCESFSRIVTQDFHEESAQCTDIVRSSWGAINRIGSTSSGLEQLTTLFKLCRPLKSVDELKNWLIDMYGNTAMVDYPYPTSFLADLPAFPARVFCANVTSPTFRSSNADEDIVKKIVKGANVFFNYTGHTECFDTGSQGTPSLGEVGWSYHSCTEFVMPMCSDGVNDMFEKQTWDFQAFSNDCFAQWSVRPRFEWPYVEYGGKNITDLRYFTNIAFTNGNLDPWSAGGLRTTVAPTLPAISITGGAHHLDLRSANKADPPSVLAARQQVVALIQKWIS